MRATLWIRTAEPPALAPYGGSGGFVGLRVAPADPFPDGEWTSTYLLPLNRNADFTRYEVFVDVPEDAARIELAVSPLSTLWIDAEGVQTDIP